MIKSIRFIIGICLIVIMIVMGVYTYNHREEFFSNKVIIEYPDGCVEIYINNEMVSPECTNGRALVEQDTIAPKDIGVGLPYGATQ